MQPKLDQRPYLDTCPVGCSAPLAATDIQLPEGPLLRCAGCGQLISQVSEESYWASMQEFDDPIGTLPVPGAKERRFKLGQRWLEKIEAALGKPRSEIRLLDVGCSSGAFLHIARELGFRTEGVEPARQAAAAASAAGFQVHQGILQEIALPQHSYDALTLFEVIEHLKDPLGLLKECHRILRPGGVLLVGTGNTGSWTAATMKARWEYFHIAKHGGHVSFFNSVSMRMLAERSGFMVEKLETRNVRFFEKGDCSRAVYALAKIASELLNAPARALGRGHDMLVLLRRKSK